jgi:hypothetical protein
LNVDDRLRTTLGQRRRFARQLFFEVLAMTLLHVRSTLWLPHAGQEAPAVDSDIGRVTSKVL